MAIAVRIRKIEVELAYFWQKRGIAWLVDVREEKQYVTGIIARAILHPYSTFEPSLLPYVDPYLGVPRRLLFFCQKGDISPRAAEAWAQEIGASVAFVMEEGFDKWLEEGLPVEEYIGPGNASD